MPSALPSRAAAATFATLPSGQTLAAAPPARTSAGGLAYGSAGARVVQPQPAAGSCRRRGSGLDALPDPRCTPGALNPAVTQASIGATICRRGWTATVRPSQSITGPEKRASIAAYGYGAPISVYEYDPHVSLQLRGALHGPAHPRAAP